MIPKKTLSARRRTGGSSGPDAKWIKGSIISLPSFKSTVQVITQDEKNNLPEGYRNRQAYVLYSNVDFRVALEGGEGEPDEVEIYGEWYEITSKGPWQNLIKHRRYIVTKLVNK